jgi:hypothetical protein
MNDAFICDAIRTPIGRSPVLKCHLRNAFQVEHAARIVGSGYLQSQPLNDLAHLANLLRIRVGLLSRRDPE